MTNTELAEAIEDSGVWKQNLATACGVSPSLVSLWLNGTRRILPRYVPIIEELTKMAGVTSADQQHQTLEV